MLNVKKSVFWPKVTKAGMEFWSEMNPLPWFDDLFRVFENEDVFICTSPSSHWTSLAGKDVWMKKYLPKYMHRKFVITPHKYLLANPNSVLVDDSEKKILPFASEGGHTILFPAPYNANREFVGKEIEYVKEQYKRILNG